MCYYIKGTKKLVGLYDTPAFFCKLDIIFIEAKVKNIYRRIS